MNRCRISWGGGIILHESRVSTSEKVITKKQEATYKVRFIITCDHWCRVLRKRKSQLDEMNRCRISWGGGIILHESRVSTSEKVITKKQEATYKVRFLITCDRWCRVLRKRKSQLDEMNCGRINRRYGIFPHESRVTNGSIYPSFIRWIMKVSLMKYKE